MVDSSLQAENTCPVRGRWDPVNAAIRGALSAIMVSEIAAPGPRLPMPAPRTVEIPVPALLAE